LKFIIKLKPSDALLRRTFAEMKQPYKKVSCDFYDELEALAVMHKDCNIAFWDENQVKAIIRDRIKNLYTSEGIEYLETRNGFKIRLDKLIEVDGKRSFSQC
jgi:Rho-binding antiterminator